MRNRKLTTRRPSKRVTGSRDQTRPVPARRREPSQGRTNGSVYVEVGMPRSKNVVTTAEGIEMEKTNLKTDHPILFKSHLIPSILSEIKDVTRRILVRQPNGKNLSPFFNEELGRGVFVGKNAFDRNWAFNCPYGTKGHLLWVKETFAKLEDLRTNDPRFKVSHTGYKALYKANYPTDRLIHDDGTEMKWRPSIFMPRALSRIDLINKGVRIERIQEITEQDALRDGGWKYPYCPIHKDPIASFKQLWDEINANPRPRLRKIKGKKVVTHYESYPWDKRGRTSPKKYKGKPWIVHHNPFVWRIEFKLKKD